MLKKTHLFALCLWSVSVLNSLGKSAVVFETFVYFLYFNRSGARSDIDGR